MAEKKQCGGFVCQYLATCIYEDNCLAYPQSRPCQHTACKICQLKQSCKDLVKGRGII